jgi:hypothetical protein
MQNQKSVSEYNRIPCFFLLIKLIRRGRTSILGTLGNFGILGISLGNLIFTQKDFATQFKKNNN